MSDDDPDLAAPVSAPRPDLAAPVSGSEPELAVGVSVPPSLFDDRAHAEAYVGVAADAGIDHLFTADHVSFRGGHGMDGLVLLAWLLGLEPSLGAYVGVYLLALRHPTAVARQLSTLSSVAPGRITLGIGVGGEDRDEMRSVEVDPATRGRRTDESLAVLRRLLTGDPVTHTGEFVHLDGVRILPPPDPPVPITVGGRSDAALRRAGRLGDGWLAAWCSPRRFAEGVGVVATEAAAPGRTVERWRHGLQVWVGVGDTPDEGRGHVGPAMERFYGVPFSAFEKYTPAGTPADIAEFCRPYVDAGATTLNLTPIGGSDVEAVAAIGEVRRLLTA